MPWLGPYTVKSVFDNSTCVLQGPHGTLKSKQHMCNLKQFQERTTEYADTNKELSDSSLSGIQAWIPSLHLDCEDKRRLENNEQLDDKVIDAAQTLLKLQYAVDGLESTLLLQAGGFAPVLNESVQIHFDECRQHWKTSSTTRHRVEIADSLFAGTLSNSVGRQLKERYASFASDNILPVYVLPVQQQQNGVDCGCHAIAIAVEFLCEDGDPQAKFDLDQMRSHLIQCFESENMERFPKSLKRQRGSKPKVHRIDLPI